MWADLWLCLFYGFLPGFGRGPGVEALWLPIPPACAKGRTYSEDFTCLSQTQARGRYVPPGTRTAACPVRSWIKFYLFPPNLRGGTRPWVTQEGGLRAQALRWSGHGQIFSCLHLI